MILYVTRHGQTEANVNNLFNGINTLDLTKTGIEQAEKLLPSLENINIDYIYCSPLKRTIHTANILNIHKKPIYIDDRLIERDCGKYTLKPINLIEDMDALYNINENKYEDFEAFSSIIERVSNFIKELKQKYTTENILIVTHGDVIVGFQKYFNKMSDGYPKTCELLKFEVK